MNLKNKIQPRNMWGIVAAFILSTSRWTPAGKNCVRPAHIAISLVQWVGEIFKQIKHTHHDFT